MERSPRARPCPPNRSSRKIMFNRPQKKAHRFAGRGFTRGANPRSHLALIFSAFVGIASAMLPLHVDAQTTGGAKVIGSKLMFMCGFGQILLKCNHINCPSSAPMIKEVD